MKTTSATKRNLYPWAQWFDGQPHVAEPGLDFDIDSRHFRMHVLRTAKRMGVVVETELLADEAVWMQAKGKDEE